MTNDDERLSRRKHSMSQGLVRSARQGYTTGTGFAILAMSDGALFLLDPTNYVYLTLFVLFAGLSVYYFVATRRLPREQE